MNLPKPQPVKSAENLRARVDRLFSDKRKNIKKSNQLSLDSFGSISTSNSVEFPADSLKVFLNFISDAIPYGDVYLFGGVLRDLALLGRKGFNSDIDLVVEGDWTHFETYLDSLHADKNKFGGYRLIVGGWEIDIWNAEETWAIKNGFVTYNDISSLTQTTVLNWDAILMNWRTGVFIYRNKYFEEINNRALDIVLEENPNPLGFTVRVFRHLCLKDARQITPHAAKYMAKLANIYSFEQIKEAELKSYKNSVIEPLWYKFFNQIDTSENENIQHQFNIASQNVRRELSLY